MPDDAALEDEVRRLRAELERERGLRAAAEALADERETAPAAATGALTAKSKRRSPRWTRHKLQGNWLPGTRRF